MTPDGTRCCCGDAADGRDLVRVVVIAEVRMYRDGLATALARDTWIEAVGTSATPAGALQLLETSPPDVIVLDPGGDPVGAVRLLALNAPEARVLVVAVRDEEADVVELAEAGAAGFVTRDESLEALVSSVLSVARGEALCSPRMAGVLLRRVTTLARDGGSLPPAPRLTVRERQIARMLDEGLSNKQIASGLYIELATVKNHVHNVLDKLGVARRSEVPARLRALSGRTEI